MRMNKINPYFLPVLLFVFSIIFIRDTGQKLYAAEISLLKQSIIPLNSLDDNKEIVKLIEQKSLVLIGDSTHGTHEFYQQRINISKDLIRKKNFKLILLEGDWPNIYILNQYVHAKVKLTAAQVLRVFNPDAVWLWGNIEMLNFIRWLKKYNDKLPIEEQKVSLYGMDIYSFEQSKQLVIDYLKIFSFKAAQQARSRYQCFDRFKSSFKIDLHRYGEVVSQNPSLSCQDEVIAQYQDFSKCHVPCPQEYSFIDREAFFAARQNALVVKNTEQSIRTQHISGNDTHSWNLRDLHMMESIQASLAHLEQPKAIIWAHNSHLGDARATEMVERKQINLGQILRQHFKDAVFSIGMLTYSGKVMAADDWNSSARLKTLLPAHPDSNEALLHNIAIPHFLLSLQQSAELFNLLNKPRLQRHVGVVYRPDDELSSHYTGTLLAQQFDAVIYHDMTTAVTPLK